MIYEQFILSDQNPMISNHKVYGQPLLPGLAYIDILFQVFRKHNYRFDRLELRQLTIYKPLIAGPGRSVKLGIRCDGDSGVSWKIRLEGQNLRSGVLEPEVTLYATAEMHQRATVSFEESLDLDNIRQSSFKNIGLHEIYEQCRSQELVHTGFMKAEGTIYDTGSAAVIDLELGRSALPGAEQFMFHPVLIDGSGVGSGRLLAPPLQEEQRLFLPLFYESFCASELLQQRCITSVQSSSVLQKNELMVWTMEFFNAYGRKVGELKNFAGKLVREAGLINPERVSPLQSVHTLHAHSVKLSTVYPEGHHVHELVTGGNKAGPNAIESYLRQLMADVLNKPEAEIDSGAGYYEMGLDSPGLLGIVRAIESRIDTSLSPTLLFEYTTITELAAYLGENYAPQFSRHDTAEQSPKLRVSAASESKSTATSSDRREGEPSEAASDDGEIAIIGMSGRYPGAGSIHEFWENLLEGKDCIGEIPDSRWDLARMNGIKSPSGKDMSRWGGFIEDADCFDSKFFRVSPREAETMDPQERLFLQTCWETIEDAGYTPKTLAAARGGNNRRNVGVFAGVMHKDYTLIGAEAWSQGQQPFPLSLTSGPIANRVSYFFNFHGPSMTVDTLCSSSLTAVHLAVESMKRGECEVALAGGVNLSLHPAKYMTYGMWGMHSSDGYCNTFGKDGDGYVSAEGVAAVLLKPLSKAVEDQDRIYAVIKGSAINHVGAVSGIMVPSPVAQGDVIAQCLERTGVDPRTISYVEAHGTGTSLGDPIEIEGLAKAFGSFTQDPQFCSIGSVKSNIGHAESAAGVIGLQKVALQIYHRTLVPSLHSEELNPYIDFSKSPFYVQRTTEEWKRPVIAEDGRQITYPRRAGLSSFGATGSNAHVILEEFMDIRRKPQAMAAAVDKARPAVVPLSAKNKDRLRAYAGKLLGYLQKLPASSLRLQPKENGKAAISEVLQFKIRELIAGIIHVEEEALETDVEWSEYGMEPVHIRQLRDRIRDEFQVETDVAELVHRSTIASVAEYLLDDHREVLEAYSEVAVHSETDEPDQNNDDEAVALEDLAYTFQIGREAMGERAVFVARDIPELIEGLEGFLQDRDGMKNCYIGQVNTNRDSAYPTSAGEASVEEAEKIIAKSIAENNMEKLAKCWVSGLDVDWSLLYGSKKPRKISLPTYPFARDRYWIPESASAFNPGMNGAGSLSAKESEAHLHPLLHENISDFSGQRFSSTFTGSEFFLNDHVVKGHKVLPGVAYLEMARIAIDRSAAAFRKSETGIRLKNVVWIRPVAAGEQPSTVNIWLKHEENGGITYEIYSMDGNDETGPIVHSRGGAEHLRLKADQVLDIRSIKDRCSEASFSSSQFYETFKAMGMDYGPGHRGIEAVYRGSGQLLAKLSLPPQVSHTIGRFGLHPSLMDSALQATIGYQMSPGHRQPPSPKPVMPFALQELEVLGDCTSAMWAWIRYSDNRRAGDQNQKLDIDLCDEQGAVRVRMKGFSTRVLEGELQLGDLSKSHRQEASAGTPVGNILLYPVWDAVPIERVERFPLPAETVLIAGGNESGRRAVQQLYPDAYVYEHRPEDTVEDIARKLEACIRINHLIWIAPEAPLKSVADDILIEEQELGVLSCFRMIKALVKLGYSSDKLGWTFITFNSQSVAGKEAVNPVHASLHGLAGSMVKEFSNWNTRIIDLEAGGGWPITDMFALPSDRRGHPWVHRNGEWYRQQLIPLNIPPKEGTRLKEGGVYVVIGGAGGIGKAWSEYMVRTYKAQIVWIGRRPLDAGIRTELARIGAFGPEPIYISADAADLNALKAAYKEMKRNFTRINGVVHSAMMLSDTGLEEMEEAEFKDGLSAKVDVSVRMAQVFREEPLDFVLFFSSLIAFIKNPKQSHYASGCTFKDAFAHRLSSEWGCSVKIMNWGYWSSADAAASSDVQQLARIGMGLIEPKDGMEALEALLSGPADQMAMIKTTKPLVIEGMNPQERIDIRSGSGPIDLNTRKQVPERIPQVQSLKLGMSRHKEMSGLLARMLLGELGALGLFQAGAAAAENASKRIGIADLYGRWFDESVRNLVRDGYLIFDGETYKVPGNASADRGTLWKEWELKRNIWLEDPNLRAWMLLAETVLRDLPDILKGVRPATDIMFPRSSMELVEGIYRNNPVADYFNEALADTLLAYIEERLIADPSAKLRIIEIGAGTGGTSSMLFQKLRPYRAHIEEYCYTDISKAFLLFAEQEYGPDNPYLTYKMFNVEAPLSGGGSSPSGEFDIAVATNVLHATRNIRQTLRHTKALMKTNGIVLINELSHPGWFTHMTFGLLEGWWLYEDEALRIPGCPGLSPETWMRVLEEEGYRSVFFPAKDAHELGQQIIAAASNGIVRRKQALHPNKAEVDGKSRSQGAQHGTMKQTGDAPIVTPVTDGSGLTDQMLEDHVKMTIVVKLSEALKVDRNDIDPDESFADYGLDSIIGVHLVQVLNQALSIELDTTSLFDYSSVNRLAAYILSDHREGVARALKPIAGGKDEVSEGIEYTSVNGVSPNYYNEAAVSKADSGPERVASMQKEPVAIIGMSGRFAKSNTVSELWKHLSEGKELIEKAQRWDLSEYRSKDPGFCDRGGFVDDIDKFDPLFFNINGLEASYMDPQMRLFMEESWKALEDSGYAGERIKGRQCGVYVGCLGGAGDYGQLFGEYAPPQAFWGSAGSVIPARIAYYLDLKGPAIAVDTACSSSLVAVHLACQSLWAGEMEMAVAGGVFVQSTSWYYRSTNKAGMLSPTGRSYTFDERADGFVPGEGVGVVVLKRLGEAIADGDQIYGVIRGSGINQDGTTNGITAPSAVSQERLECSVYDTFHIDPGQIQVIEAHGTGTKLGDPIEYQALTRAFRKYTDKKEFCAIGSVKTNIGHAAHAAGVAGMIKILLSMQHKQIPASLHFETGNPNIPFKDSPFYVNTKLRAWETASNVRRCAAVSSFGFSGTNAHIVLEEAPQIVRSHAEKPGYLIALSARTPEQLRRQAGQLIEFCEENGQTDCGNISFTLLLGRKHLGCRLACIVRNPGELASFLKQWLAGSKAPQVYVTETKDHDRREQLSLKRYGNQCIRECADAGQAGEYLVNLSTIAELHVQGYNLEFEPLFAMEQYAVVSLPTYPFADERYWVPADKKSAEAGVHAYEASERMAFIHPLLHRNTSDFTGVRFSSAFTGTEFYLAPHVLRGSNVLPGTAYLEMARAALTSSGGDAPGDRGGLRLKDMVWASPVGIGEDRVHIEIFPEADDEISYEVYTRGKSGGETIIHNQGRAAAFVPDPGDNARSFDLAVVRSACSLRRYTREQWYKAFEENGVRIRPEHQGIEELFVGEAQVLVKLSLNESIRYTQDQFVLHPCLWESALQASIALPMAANDGSGGESFKPVAPVSLRQLDIIGRSDGQIWGLIRYSNYFSGGTQKSLDIDFCDRHGSVFAGMRGLVTRVPMPVTEGPSLSTI